MTAPEFERELTALINRHSLESGSDTPDFILARFMLGCLSAWNEGIAEREQWYGRPEPPAAPTTIPTEGAP